MKSEENAQLNSFMTEAVIICKSMDWFLYDNGLRHERVKLRVYFYITRIFITNF